MNQIINADPHGRITLQGHDAVAFHVDGKQVKGEPTLAVEYLGYKYWFSSEANKTTFEEQPEKYLPAYGGFCAYGVTLDVLAPVDINTWEIIDGRLILQFSPAAKEKFAENRDEQMLNAQENYSRIQNEQAQSVANGASRAGLRSSRPEPCARRVP